MMRYIGQKHINIKKLYSGRNKDAGTDESAITVRKAESVQIPKGYTDGKKRCLKASRNAYELVGIRSSMKGVCFTCGNKKSLSNIRQK